MGERSQGYIFSVQLEWWYHQLRQKTQEAKFDGIGVIYETEARLQLQTLENDGESIEETGKSLKQGINESVLSMDQPRKKLLVKENNFPR